MKKQTTLSVVITAYNEGSRIARLLTSVRKLADEIIVVDCASTDNTAEIAKKFTSKIFKQPNFPMLNKNKNFGFSKATGDWILCLDADEEIPSELASEIRSKIEHPSIVGYWIPRKNIIFGKWIQHGLWWPDKQMRLFKKGRGKYLEKHVHEYILIEGPTDELHVPYVHYNYESISQYLWKMEHIYTENEVVNLLATGYTVSWYDALRFPISDFLKIYFAQEGYKDGLHGLVLSLLQSFYSFIVFAKLWEKQKFMEQEIPFSDVTDEMVRSNKELRYWIFSTAMKETSSWIHTLWYRLRRKLM